MMGAQKRKPCLEYPLPTQDQPEISALAFKGFIVVRVKVKIVKNLNTDFVCVVLPAKNYQWLTTTSSI